MKTDCYNWKLVVVVVVFVVVVVVVVSVIHRLICTIDNIHLQALFYMIIFRHKQLLDLEAGEQLASPSHSIFSLYSSL